MKKLSGILWFSLLFVVVAPAGAGPQFGRNDRNDNRGADRVCVYQDNYFQGWEQCYRPGDEIADLGSHGNSISSIRVYGNAMVTIYDDRNFRGQSTQITSEVKDLGQFSAGGAVFGGRTNWNDRIGSLRVSSSNYGDSRDNRRDDRYNQGDYRGPDGQGRYNNGNGVCVFEDINYRGRSQCFNSGADLSDLGRLGGWSDRISSIRVMGNERVVAFVDVNYRGERLVIDRDIPDLRSFRLRNNRSWDNQISSLEVGGRGAPVGRRYYGR